MTGSVKYPHSHIIFSSLGFSYKNWGTCFSFHHLVKRKTEPNRHILWFSVRQRSTGVHILTRIRTEYWSALQETEQISDWCHGGAVRIAPWMSPNNFNVFFSSSFKSYSGVLHVIRLQQFYFDKGKYQTLNCPNFYNFNSS